MNSINRKIGYIYSNDVRKYDYGHYHPMKTKRTRMVHDFLFHYGTLEHMDCYVNFF